MRSRAPTARGTASATSCARTGYLGTDPAPRADAYVEFHIEGNDALETAGLTIGPSPATGAP
jgi:beta-ureidopropionase / N-carbamoyl-L-amino-acid hydrolase